MIITFLIGLFLILITLIICGVLKIATICDEEEIELNKKGEDYERKNSKTN